jgi:hypothetical protein
VKQARFSLRANRQCAESTLQAEQISFWLTFICAGRTASPTAPQVSQITSSIPFV